MADRLNLLDVLECPLLRCSAIVSSDAPRLCGRPAPWQGFTGPHGSLAFHCDEHRATADAAIVDPVVFTRLRVELAAVFAVPEWVTPIGEADALRILAHGVRTNGGLFELSGVTRQRCRYTPETAGRRVFGLVDGR